MAYKTIEYEKIETQIVLVTMVREREMNTLSVELMEELGNALRKAREDSEVKVIIITGKGRVFCCGAHLRYIVGERPFDLLQLRDYLIRVQDLFTFIEELEKPVIAAINGFALGGGAEMALASDFRIMSDSAKFGVPEIRLGALAGAGGVQRLPGIVGRGKAIELNMLGTHLNAEEAERIGLLYMRVPAEKLMDAAMTLARELAGKSPLALALIKSCINSAQNTTSQEAMRQGLESMLLCATSEIQKEGIRAFFEKREPEFPGLSFGVNK